MTVKGALDKFVQSSTRVALYVPGDKEAAPFVKWAGGKRSILDELVNRLPPSFQDYYEPFMGGAALYFEVQERLREAFLSDSNLDLVLTFNVVKKEPLALITKLEEHAQNDSSEYFYKIRSLHDLQSPVDIAARFIYLNKTCYNGLFRVNKKGEFNVPRGQFRDGAYVVQRENILACSKVLQKVKINYCEFDEIKPNSGDFVYFDPPYHPSDSSSFTKYTKLDFSEKDQERLRDFATQLVKNGIKVMLSNSDTAYIRNLYSSNMWYTDTIQAPRFVNCKPDGRGAVNEVLITSYPVTKPVTKKLVAEMK